MKIGEYTFKRRYTLAQIIVDIISAVVLLGFLLIVSAHIEWAQWFDRQNRTDYVLHKEWYPMIIWIVLGAVVMGLSFFLMFRKKKQPKKLCITENNVVKYDNALNTGIALVRLMVLLLLWNVCSVHSDFILWGQSEINYLTYVIGLLIIVGIVILTKMRADALSETEKKAGAAEKKYIVED